MNANPRCPKCQAETVKVGKSPGGKWQNYICKAPDEHRFRIKLEKR